MSLLTWFRGETDTPPASTVPQLTYEPTQETPAPKKRARPAKSASAVPLEPPQSLEDPLASLTPDLIPEYILKASEAAGEWWAKSDQDPRIKFQPAIILRLLLALRAGTHYEPACVLAGVSYRAFREWMNKAEDEGEESPFARVAAAVKVAEAEAEAESIGYVRAASRDPRFWAAGMTFLERRHPERWKRQDGPAVSVQVGVKVGIQAGDSDRQRLLPDVVIQQIASNNADRSPLGIAPAPSHTFASPPSLSPVSINSKPVENTAK